MKIETGKNLEPANASSVLNMKNAEKGMLREWMQVVSRTKAEVNQRTLAMKLIYDKTVHDEPWFETLLEICGKSRDKAKSILNAKSLLTKGLYLGLDGNFYVPGKKRCGGKLKTRQNLQK